MPEKYAKRHQDGDWHIHDVDSYNLTTNCLHIDLLNHLSSGFNTGYGYIRPPKRIESAAELTCILIQSSQNDLYGGQSIVDFDNALGAYVEPTRQEVIRNYSKLKEVMTEEEFDNFVEEKLEERVHQAMQNICYNLNTMHSRAG